MNNSVSNYNWTADATNSVYGFSDANVTINGTLGTVDSQIYMSSGPNIVVPSVPVLAVSNYQMTNTSWWLNEFQFYGSIGFGRPSATNLAAQSLLTTLVNSGIIASTVWAYQPYGNPGPLGYIEVGGYNESLAAAPGTLKWTPAPVNAASPDKWTTQVTGLEMTVGSYS